MAPFLTTGSVGPPHPGPGGGAAPGRSTRTVAPTGSLDRVTSGAVRRALQQARREDSDVVVDLSGVDFVDSVGLGVLLTASRSARAAGRAVHVVRPTERVARALRITGLDRLLDVRDAAAAR